MRALTFGLALACALTGPARAAETPPVATAPDRPVVVLFTGAGWPSAERRVVAELALLDVQIVERSRPDGVGAAAKRGAQALAAGASAAIMVSRSQAGQAVVWAWIAMGGVGRTSTRVIEDQDLAEDAALAAVDLVKAGLVSIRRLESEANAPTAPAPPGDPMVKGRVGLELGVQFADEERVPSVQLGLSAGLHVGERFVAEAVAFLSPGPRSVADSRGSAEIGTVSLVGMAGLELLPGVGPVQLEVLLGGGVLWAWVTSTAGGLRDVGDRASTGVAAARVRAAVPVDDWLQLTVAVSVLVAPHPIRLGDDDSALGRLGLPLVELGLGLCGTFPEPR